MNIFYLVFESEDEALSFVNAEVQKYSQIAGRETRLYVGKHIEYNLDEVVVELDYYLVNLYTPKESIEVPANATLVTPETPISS